MNEGDRKVKLSPVVIKHRCDIMYCKQFASFSIGAAKANVRTHHFMCTEHVKDMLLDAPTEIYKDMFAEIHKNITKEAGKENLLKIQEFLSVFKEVNKLITVASGIIEEIDAEEKARQEELEAAEKAKVEAENIEPISEVVQASIQENIKPQVKKVQTI
ncbi:MAG: hypothetical protein SFH39_00035 [Candidatus Magnetobacterium sp. LHC-1]